MKKTLPNPKDEQIIDYLKRILKRVEEVTIDISTMKTDLRMLKFNLMRIEHDSGIIKADVERIRDNYETKK